MTDEMKMIIEKVDPVEMVRLGGAGNKVNRIALGEVDCYISPTIHLKFWDLCAPEAILRGMGGIASKLHLESPEEMCLVK